MTIRGSLAMAVCLAVRGVAALCCALRSRYSPAGRSLLCCSLHVDDSDRCGGASCGSRILRCQAPITLRLVAESTGRGSGLVWLHLARNPLIQRDQDFNLGRYPGRRWLALPLWRLHKGMK